MGDYATVDDWRRVLCFEGVEKVLHMLEARKHKEDPAQSQQRLEKLAAQDPLKFERTK